MLSVHKIDIAPVDTNSFPSLAIKVCSICNLPTWLSAEFYQIIHLSKCCLPSLPSLSSKLATTIWSCALTTRYPKRLLRLEVLTPIDKLYISKSTHSRDQAYQKCQRSDASVTVSGPKCISVPRLTQVILVPMPSVRFPAPSSRSSLCHCSTKSVWKSFQLYDSKYVSSDARKIAVLVLPNRQHPCREPSPGLCTTVEPLHETLMSWLRRCSKHPFHPVV